MQEHDIGAEFREMLEIAHASGHEDDDVTVAAALLICANELHSLQESFDKIAKRLKP